MLGLLPFGVLLIVMCDRFSLLLALIVGSLAMVVVVKCVFAWVLILVDCYI